MKAKELDFEFKKKLQKYYLNNSIATKIANFSKNREIAVFYYGKGFGKRPDIIEYPNDVKEMAKLGATSFHSSEELWENPLNLSTGMRKKDLDDLRIGWDLLIDIDCDELEYSKFAAHLIVQALSFNGIDNVSVKFSGNHGFHIGVPFESFPKTVGGKDLSLVFPEGVKQIALYLKEFIKTKLAVQILKIKDLEEVAKDFNVEVKDIIKNESFNPFAVISIDTILISSRHMFRMPFSVNEKSGLISIPIENDHILDFEKHESEIDVVLQNIDSYPEFLNREKSQSEEGKYLLVQSMDFNVKEENEVKQTHYDDIPKEKIDQQYFPPCINLIFNGLEDGRQRALFILVNFLKSVGWGFKEIDEYIRKWNDQNEEPLKEAIIRSHLSYHARKKQIILPPNCDNKAYYLDFHVCKPDNLCQYIKNPVQYSKRKVFFMDKEQKEGKPKDKEKKPTSKEEKLKGKPKNIEGKDETQKGNNKGSERKKGIERSE